MKSISPIFIYYRGRRFIRAWRQYTSKKMKIKFLFTLALALACSHAQAQVFRSAFGFTTEISENWIIVSRETVSSNPDLLNFEASEMKGFDSNLKAQVKQMAMSGRIELLYYKHSDADFNDNINLFVSNPQRTDLALAISPLCNDLQAQLQQAYSRTDFTEVYGCALRRVYSTDTVSYAFDGAVIGSRSYGYLFNSGSGTITLTITCKNSKCDEVRTDAESLFLDMQH